MSGTPIEALDLAALLCSRVCHDLISPVGAIVNGLEVLAEEKDEETKTFALDLIKKSAGTASAKLQFCRIAFGAAGSAGAQIDLGDAETICARLFRGRQDQARLESAARRCWPKNRVKLLLNLLLIAGQTIPRGGRLTVDPIGAGESMGFKVSAAGVNAKVPPAVAALLAGETGGTPLDAHRIQPFYASLLAQACGVKVAMAMEGEAVVVTRAVARVVPRLTKRLNRATVPQSATKIKRFTDTLAALPTESGGRASACRRRRFSWTICCGNS